MRRFLSFFATLAGFALAFGVAGPSSYAQDKSTAAAKKAVAAEEGDSPVAVLSLTNLDKLLSDTAYILRACNVPEVGGLVSVMANQYTQGLDRSRPLGLSVTMDGETPVPVGFLPVEDRAAFFDALAAIGIEPDDLGDGLFEIEGGGSAIFVKDANGWLFISQTEEALDDLPANPAAALGELPNKYDLALKVNVQAIPDELSEMMIDQIRGGFERSLAEQGDDEESERAREMGEASVEQMEKMLDETEQFVFGWAIDAEGQKTYFDGAAQFVAGSDLAAQSDANKSLKTAFSAFKLPNPCAVFRNTSKIAESDKVVAKNSLNNSMEQAIAQIEDNVGDEKVRDTILEFVDNLHSLLEKTIDEGSMDGILSASVDGDQFRVLAGGRIADGKALAQAVQDAVADLSGIPEVPKFDFNYETYNGMTLHRTTVPVETDDQVVKKMFGDSIKVTIGTADKAFALSVDPNGDSSLKAAIDAMKKAPSTTANLLDGIIEVGKIVEYAQAISPNSQLDIVLQSIKENAGKDKVLMTGNVIERGAMYRFSIDEGVLKALGAVAKAGQGNAGGF